LELKHDLKNSSSHTVIAIPASLDQKLIMAETLGNVLRRARKQKGLVLRQVAAAAGVSVAAVGNWEKDENDITMDNLRTVADYLGIDAEAAHRGVLEWVEETHDLNEAERIGEPGPFPSGPRDVRVLGVTVGGDDADFTFNGEIVEYVRRPPGIAGLNNVFALHVLGTSMVPRYEPGEMIYCGGRAPVEGDYVVLEAHPTKRNGPGKCYIKKLMKWSSPLIICEQFNPPEQLSFPTTEIKAMHRVIPWTEVLGY
jgi:phage repressor protein C with HTH and peptisase S24 domain